MWRMKLIFCLLINLKGFFKGFFRYQSLLQGILSLLIGRIKHSQSTQSNKFTMSLQYLKKKLGVEFIFSMPKNIKVGIIALNESG